MIDRGGALRAVLSARLHAAWAGLDRPDRLILLLSVDERLTAPEAAAVLGLAPAEYRRRRRLARRALREGALRRVYRGH